MKVNVTSNLREALGELTEMEAQQLPHAVRLGLNRLANDVQAGIRDKIKRAFDLRRVSFNLNSVKIFKPDRATKSTWRVVITLDPRASHFEKFEEGGTKRPMGDHRWIWLPNTKVFKNQVISRSNPLHPKNLHLHRDSAGRIIGDQRTFVVKDEHGDPIVVQRQHAPWTGWTRRSMKKLRLDNFDKRDQILVSKKRKPATRVLYRLRSAVSVEARLEFAETGRKVVEDRAISRFREAMDEAWASRHR